MKYRVLVRVFVQDIETNQIGKTEMKQLWKEAKALNSKNIAIADITVDDSELLIEAVNRYELLESQEQLPKLKIFSDVQRPERYTGRVDSGF